MQRTTCCTRTDDDVGELAADGDGIVLDGWVDDESRRAEGILTGQVQLEVDDEPDVRRLERRIQLQSVSIF